jgi:hypothetical protein
MTINDQTALDNIEAAAKKDAGFMPILRFIKGEFFLNGDEEVTLGTEYIVHPEAYAKTWIKFGDGVVLERKDYDCAAGEEPPDADENGVPLADFAEDDHDQTRWRLGPDGKPKCPWVLQASVPFADPTSETAVLFSTSSVFGKAAVADLCRTWAQRCRRGLIGLPVVEVQAGKKKTKKFGKVDVPSFPIVRWDGDAMAPLSVAPQSSDVEMDEIPFGN